MNKLVYVFFVFFSFYLGNMFAILPDSGLFTGYKTVRSTNDNSLFPFSRNQYNNFNSLDQIDPSNLSTLIDNYVPNLNYSTTSGSNLNRFSTLNNRQPPYDSGIPLNSERNNSSFLNDTTQFASNVPSIADPNSSLNNSNITSKIISGVNDKSDNERFIYDNSRNSNSNPDSNTTSDSNPIPYDSGIPISPNPTINTNREPLQNNPQSGQVDTNVYYARLPSNYLRNALDIRNRYNPGRVVYKRQIRYPNFLLFANDVICTTERGITDGMIFYTPHGTYKLKGNLLLASNDTYLISGNKIWLDNMVYYFDDSGVYLNNKIYRFNNNVMYKDGIKYLIEGTIVTTEGAKGNRRCIVSELVE